jgi:hypothetical protein
MASFLGDMMKDELDANKKRPANPSFFAGARDSKKKKSEL